MNMGKFIHMQRYYKTIAIMLICSLLLTGCTTRNSGQEDDAEVKTSYEFNADKSQVSEKSRSAYSENGYYYFMILIIILQQWFAVTLIVNIKMKTVMHI
mgnify:CR=1 FL=1